MKVPRSLEPVEIDVHDTGGRNLEPRGDRQAGLEQRVTRGRLGVRGGRPPDERGTAREGLGLREPGADTPGTRPGIGLDDPCGRWRTDHHR
jgi:hypothetical protein